MSKLGPEESAMRMWDFMCECGHGRWQHYSYNPHDRNPQGREERNAQYTNGKGPCSDTECSRNQLCKAFKQIVDEK